MDTSSNDRGPPETKAPSLHEAENASLISGTGTLETPQKHAADVTPKLCTPQTFKSPLNFSTVTVEQLGITPESFVKNSSGKSSFYRKKSRRRSAIGARGSPETNHLIRFMAQQRALKSTEKSPLALGSPFQGSPGLYRNVNSLRERISAFQSAFHSKESEKMASCPETSEAEGSEVTGLAKKEGQGGGWQPGFPAESSSKRRKISSESSSKDGLGHAGGSGVDPQTPRSSVDTRRAAGASLAPPEISPECRLSQSGCIAEWVPCPAVTEASNGLEVADCVAGTGSGDAVPLATPPTEVSGTSVPEGRSPPPPVCRREVSPTETFVLRSVLKKPCVKPSLDSLQEHHTNLCDDGMHPSLTSNLLNCCKEQKAEDQENCKVPTFLNMRKRKRVTFGEELSPEVFDESLPANTPLRRGGTPARQKDFGSLSLQLPEESPVPEPLPQPDFDAKGEDLENIEPLQISFAALSPNKSSISETLSGTDTFSSSNNQKKISSWKAGRLARTSNRRNQLTSVTEENVSNLHNVEAQPCKEKKVNRRKSQDTKYANRAVSKKKQVFKSGRKKKRKGKKSVEKSLYGEREIASKKPLLSPIPELPEGSEATPSVPGIRRPHSDDFSSTGKLGNLELLKTPAKRETLLLQSPDLHLQQGLHGADAFELCCSDVTGSSLPMATSDEDSDANADTDDSANIPKAENEQEFESELKTELETESSHASSASVTREHRVSDNPRPDLIPQLQEVAVAGQIVEKLCQIFKTAKDINIKLKEQDDFVATEGKLQCNSMSDSQQEFNSLEDVLIKKSKESESHSEDAESQPAESGSVTGCRGGKCGQLSLCRSDAHSVCSQQSGNHSPSYGGVGSSAEVSLRNSELCKDLSDAIEQAFQRTSSETKVRRSTRLQKNSENQGLVWLSLPFPSTSQKAKRRTICSLDRREFESSSPRKETVCSGQNPGVVTSVSGEESSQGQAALGSRVPGKRRKSFCAFPKEKAESLGGEN
ncbi:cell division cycle-associated protein 2 isoform X1 [Heterocephalus glaber]|uniref:Cell division cycle-associated protein 2 isoform X1 n=2 Tax=Heterocephalus glaber TaxID=10181 RepID=A0AAX6T4V5_HETGA|nr:cell division cycle-associated protein 2 isoform X1 [Heterocephalus glaber]XP_004848420.1 cell division cycle-associated protein 2 isoform X1 [Heterocephalus glaber]XP_021116954.1 cell division cycle-associated protein 2 isoform X1 [Heterocephalus glaber]XP_021116956.1 cell division cycle-associated protein 2 isoform X1 [Heterocephalus glaber]